MTKEKRIGAKSQKDISPLILDQLNTGQIESVNLTEWLAVDHSKLINSVLSGKYQKICSVGIEELKSRSVLQMIRAIGLSLSIKIQKHADKELFDELKTHKSDSVRCWAAYVIGLNNTMSLETKLNEIKPFASDSHFGVREIAWMAVREDIAANLERAISILSDWAKSDDPNIRRFASESTRPNGVWCKHIERLKIEPQLALIILEQLREDPSKYVQDSVANWLNDASKTQPHFVVELCEKWGNNNSSKATGYIINRAMRTILKK